LRPNTNLRHCVKVRYDVPIGFDWRASGSPDPLAPHDFFSIRWTGWLKAPKPGKYALRLRADDNARLWLDGQFLLDRWDRTVYSASTEVDLDDRPHEIRLEYVQLDGGARMKLDWAVKDGSVLLGVPREVLFHDLAAADKAGRPQLPCGRISTSVTPPQHYYCFLTGLQGPSVGPCRGHPDCRFG
jgi:hypothetical protein